MMIAPEVSSVPGQDVRVDIGKVQTKIKWGGRIAKSCFSTLVVRKQELKVNDSTLQSYSLTKVVKDPDKIVKEYIKM